MRFLIIALITLGLAPAAYGATPEIGMHSMLYLNSPSSLKQQMFAAAARAHAPEIRLDVDLNQLQAPSVNFWGDLAEYGRLSARYHMPILANLPGDGLPSPNLNTYVSELASVAHAAPFIHDFEIVNEPDGTWAFNGTAAQYGQLLGAAYHLLHPLHRRVILGGIMYPNDQSFVRAAVGAGGRFDIANVHLRGTLGQLRAWASSWHRSFHQPLWITETGYPSDPRYQYDPAYDHGLRSQANFLKRSLPELLRYAQRVFVTERDNLTGQFASEGIVGKPAFSVVAALNN